MLVRVIVCLLSFHLYRLAARNGSSHCIGPKKKQATLLVCFFRFFVCSFAYLFGRLFICVSCSFFLCFFLVSLLFDDRCSDKCQNLDEYFDKNRQVYEFLCVPLKPTTFGVSFPEVIMIANVFTSQKHQIL